MNFISLFSGIGGFDLGMERAGMQPIAQVEIDGRCQDVLARHWPNVRRFSDVREFGRKSIPDAVDLVCGGFPCQDLSVAGKRAGLAGERSGLWFEFARVIDEFEPRWAVIENVPGLLSSDSGRDFSIILQWLVKRGYGVVWRVLDIQYFGLAQRRRRVFIVASLGSGHAAEILFEREGFEMGVKAATHWCYPTLDTNTIGNKWMSNQWYGGGYAIFTGKGIRKATPTECERLQGFPDGWTDGQSDSVRYRQLGNAAPPPFAEWIGRRICHVQSAL